MLLCRWGLQENNPLQESKIQHGVNPTDLLTQMIPAHANSGWDAEDRQSCKEIKENVANAIVFEVA